jgi:hypothetical protein
MGLNQARVARMEGGDPQASIEALVRAHRKLDERDAAAQQKIGDESRRLWRRAGSTISPRAQRRDRPNPTHSRLTAGMSEFRGAPLRVTSGGRIGARGVGVQTFHRDRDDISKRRNHTTSLSGFDKYPRHWSVHYVHSMGFGWTPGDAIMRYGLHVHPQVAAAPSRRGPHRTSAMWTPRSTIVRAPAAVP